MRFKKKSLISEINPSPDCLNITEMIRSTFLDEVFNCKRRAFHLKCLLLIASKSTHQCSKKHASYHAHNNSGFSSVFKFPTNSHQKSKRDPGQQHHLQKFASDTWTYSVSYGADAHLPFPLSDYGHYSISMDADRCLSDSRIYIMPSGTSKVLHCIGELSLSRSLSLNTSHFLWSAI